jgi:hypothetical protein
MPEPPGAVEIPAWCALLQSGYYNDYEYAYASDSRLHQVAAMASNGPVDAARLHDLADRRELMEWIRTGYLVPGES